MRHRPRSSESRSPALHNLRGVTARKRFGSILLYTTGALIMAISSSFVFNFMDHDTEFAIAVTGSLIGGFLGAMLAAAVIVDVYAPSEHIDEE